MMMFAAGMERKACHSRVSTCPMTSAAGGHHRRVRAQGDRARRGERAGRRPRDPRRRPCRAAEEGARRRVLVPGGTAGVRRRRAERLREHRRHRADGQAPLQLPGTGRRRVRHRTARQPVPRQPRADRAVRASRPSSTPGRRSPRSASPPAAPTRPARSAPPPTATATCTASTGTRCGPPARTHARYGIVYARTDRPRAARGISASDRRRGHAGHDRHARGGAARPLDQRGALRRLRGARGEPDRRGGPGLRPGPGVARARAAHGTRRRPSASPRKPCASPVDWAKQRETLRCAARHAAGGPVRDRRRAGARSTPPGYLTWEAAWDADQGRDARTKASIAKLYGTEAAFQSWTR